MRLGNINLVQGFSLSFTGKHLRYLKIHQTEQPQTERSLTHGSVSLTYTYCYHTEQSQAVSDHNRRYMGGLLLAQPDKRMICSADKTGGWDGGGRRLLAIILHRFTPVKVGWARNEVWDLGMACVLVCTI
jgi:hypothetical protein